MPGAPQSAPRPHKTQPQAQDRASKSTFPPNALQRHSESDPRIRNSPRTLQNSPQTLHELSTNSFGLQRPSSSSLVLPIANMFVQSMCFPHVFTHAHASWVYMRTCIVKLIWVYAFECMFVHVLHLDAMCVVCVCPTCFHTGVYL